MTLKEFAEQIGGHEYNYPQFTKEEISIARRYGFVIVHGASDDLIEFSGAIDDESGALYGGIVRFNCEGFADDGNYSIKAYWCGECEGDVRKYEATWEYETDIQHEEFLIREDDEIYCKGIVFSIDDLR